MKALLAVFILLYHSAQVFSQGSRSFQISFVLRDGKGHVITGDDLLYRAVKTKIYGTEYGLTLDYDRKSSTFTMRGESISAREGIGLIHGQDTTLVLIGTTYSVVTLTSWPPKPGFYVVSKSSTDYNPNLLVSNWKQHKVARGALWFVKSGCSLWRGTFYERKALKPNVL